MQQNELEKQVKEMMNDFQVIPSEPVWNKIKKQLHKKRRRVWPYIFLLLMLALTSGAIIYFNDVMHKNLKQSQTAANNKKDNLNSKKIQEIKKQDSEESNEDYINRK